MDQTGRFLVSSREVNEYIMVIYNYDGNSIDTELMQSRASSEMIQAHKNNSEQDGSSRPQSQASEYG